MAREDSDVLWREVRFCNEELKEDPDDSLAYLFKGLSLNRLGRYDEGFECLDRAVAIDRKRLKDAVAEERACRGSASHGDKRRVARMLRDDLRGVEEEVHTSKGVALSRMRRYHEAASHFKRALKLNPLNGLTHFMTGCALDDMGTPSDSIRHFDEAMRLRYREPFVYQRRAHALNNCGRTDECIECLREVLEMRPGYAEAHYEMGAAYLSVKDFGRAIKCYKRAIEADPRHKKAHEFLGIAYMAVCQDDLARPYLERALDLAPGDPDVLETARAWAERNAAANRDDPGA